MLSLVVDASGAYRNTRVVIATFSCRALRAHMSTAPLAFPGIYFVFSNGSLDGSVGRVTCATGWMAEESGSKTYGRTNPVSHAMGTKEGVLSLGKANVA